MSKQCQSGSPNAKRIPESSLFSTVRLAAGAPPPAEMVFFATQEASVDGLHVTNLPQKGMLGDGDILDVRNVAIEFIGGAIPDINRLNANYVLTVEIGQDVVISNQPLSMFPQFGGAFGIEGVNGASSNGPTGWNSVREIVSFVITGNRKITGKISMGAGATPGNMSAATPIRIHFVGADQSSI